MLEFVEYELRTLPVSLVKDQPEIYDLPSAEVQARGVQNIRVQNLAITIDKVVHLLKTMKTTDPPIFPLSQKEIYERLWTDERSLRDQLLCVLESLKLEIKDSEQAPKVARIQELLANMIIPLSLGKAEDGYAQANAAVRKKLLEISEVLREIKCESVQTFQLSDILFLYGHTKSYFTTNGKYSKIVSTEVQVRLCDVTSESKIQGELTADEQAQGFYKGVKEYDSSFVCGQLAGWFKQTVDKPNASLSAERRGTLSYPDLDSFILKRPPPKQHEGTARQICKKNAGQHIAPLIYEESEGDEESAQKKHKKSKKAGVYPLGVLEPIYNGGV